MCQIVAGQVPPNAALAVAAEVVQGLPALALLVGEERDSQGLVRDGADVKRRLGRVRGPGLADDLLAVAHAGHRRGAVGRVVLGHRVLNLRGQVRVRRRVGAEHRVAGDLEVGSAGRCSGFGPIEAITWALW